MRNQEYKYTHHRNVRSICWNLSTDFINVNKFGAFSVILRGRRACPRPAQKMPTKRLCLLSQNGENVLIFDFQMLSSMMQGGGKLTWQKDYMWFPFSKFYGCIYTCTFNYFCCTDHSYFKLCPSGYEQEFESKPEMLLETKQINYNVGELGM